MEREKVREERSVLNIGCYKTDSTLFLPFSRASLLTSSSGFWNLSTTFTCSSLSFCSVSFRSVIMCV